MSIVAVDEASKYVFYEQLKNGKKAKYVEKVMDRLVELNTRYGHKVKCIRTDREAVFLACQGSMHMKGVDTEETPIDGHTKSVERVIGILNEKRKAKIQELILRGIDMPNEYKRGILDKAIVQVMNTTSREEEGEDGRPPYEYLEGKKVDLKKHMQYGYGDVVWTTKAVSERDPMKGNTELGIVLYREMGVPGGYRVYIFGKMRALVRVPIRRTETMEGVPQRFQVRTKKEHEEEGRIEEEIILEEGRQEEEEVKEDGQEEERIERIQEEERVEEEGKGERDENEVWETEAEEKIIRQRKERKRNRTKQMDAEQQKEMEEELRRIYREKKAARREEVKSKVHMTRRKAKEQEASGKRQKQKEGKKVQKKETESEKVEEAIHMTVEKARIEYPEIVDKTWQAEISQLLEKKVFKPAEINRLSYIERQTRMMRLFMMITPKYNADGEFTKLKARYNANPRTLKQKGWKGDNSSPTSTMEAIYISLHLAATRDRKVKTYDITGAFLHAWLKEEERYWGIIQKELVPYVISIQPELKSGLMKNGELVVEIQKALYGLEESPKRFYEKLVGEIKEIGYTSTIEDPCVLVKGENRVFVAKDMTNTVVTHVDDILVTYESKQEQEMFEEMLKKVFKKYTESDLDEGPINFTGMTIRRKEEGHIEVTQMKIINDLLEDKEIKGKQMYPANEEIFKVHKEAQVMNDKEAMEFLSTIMTLMYVGKRTRYDIMLPLSYLCTRVKTPTIEDKEKLKRLLEYINMTREHGVVFRADANDRFSVYCDAGYNCHHDGKGHSGIIYKLGCNTIGIKSIKQRIVSRSSCEAELICIETAVQEAIWINEMARSMGVRNDGKIEVYEDNKSAIILVMRGFSKINRHLANRYHFVHQKIQEGTVVMKYLKTEEHIADLLTKGIIGPAFRKHAERAMEGKE